MIIMPPIRGQDDYGSGQYLAPRSNRKHNGIDYCCYPSSSIYSPVYGIVTKLGYAYGDDLSFRFVEIKTIIDDYIRVFYIEPVISKGSIVSTSTIIGLSQTLQNRYPADKKHKKPIADHFHVEVFKLVKGNKIYTNPLEYFA